MASAACMTDGVCLCVALAAGEGGVGDRERKRVHHPTRATGTGVVE
jgi:hypothetical protein